MVIFAGVHGFATANSRNATEEFTRKVWITRSEELGEREGKG